MKVFSGKKIFPAKSAKLQSAIKYELDNKLTKLEEERLEAIKDIPKNLSRIELLLLLPQCKRSILLLFHLIKSKLSQQAFDKWMIYTKKMKLWLYEINMKRLKASVIIQTMIRKILAKSRVNKLKEKRILELIKKRNSKATIIQCCIRKFVAIRKVKRKRTAKLNSELGFHAIPFQSLYRGFIVRVKNNNKERILLVQDLKILGQGRMNALVEKIELVDIRASILIELAMDVSQLSSIPYHSLPDIKVFRFYRNLLIDINNTKQEFKLNKFSQFNELMNNRFLMSCRLRISFQRFLRKENGQ